MLTFSTGVFRPLVASVVAGARLHAGGGLDVAPDDPAARPRPGHGRQVDPQLGGEAPRHRRNRLPLITGLRTITPR